MAAIDWYGPLIDLSQAAAHIGDYVQLLVFVHRSRPIQKFKASHGGGLLKTDIQVGDDTRAYFPVSIWQKQMASMIFAGDIVLLQNVKIARYGVVLEVATVKFSSLLTLVHPSELLDSKGVDELVGQCRVGATTKRKLKKVIQWVQQSGLTLHNINQIDIYASKGTTKQKGQLARNWKIHEKREARHCISISEVSCLTESYNAIFHAWISELFLPFIWKPDGEFEREKMFVSKRVSSVADNNLVEDLVCTGCKLCGLPIDSGSLCCQKSSNHVHSICLIYRPFLLYVWDPLEHIPLLVKNNAAEVLFGSITAESVYASYQGQKQYNDRILDCEGNSKGTTHSRATGEAETGKSKGERKTLNFHGIWLILLKVLLQQGKNSPLRFEVAVNYGLEQEDGRFELVNLKMPCYRSHAT